jgi:N-acetylmuramoyl-L-alanine amidase
MRTAAAIAFSATILLAQSERTSVHSVTAVRIWGQIEATRVAIEVSGSFEYKYDRLHNPERVYFDIKGASPRIAGRRIFNKTIEDKIVQRIRVAETSPGVTRVVLDVAGPVDVAPSQLTNPNRLIVELRLSAAAPAPTIDTVAPAVKAAPPIKAEVPPAELPKPQPPHTEPVPARTEKADAIAPEAPKLDPVVKAEAPGPQTPVSRPVPAALKTETPLDRHELAKAARHNSAGANSLTRALGLKLNRIVLDAGHGGHDVGTVGAKGLQEKDLVLDITLRLGKLIEQGMGAEVIYTRSDDTFIPLTERPAIANEKKADLFLSIHANSSPYPRITGVETYYLNFTDSKEAMDLAARENAGSQQTIFDLETLAKKIALHEKLDESREFAGRMQSAMFAFSSRTFPGQKNRGVKKAPFVVLIGAQMPAVLAEIGFVTNSREEQLLKKPEYRQKIAESLYKGISRYAESLSHFQLANAQ